jgi:hypothetical protein
MDENYREIVRHRRLYSDTKQQSMDWLPYLRQLSIRPRAFKYSGIYDMMPPAMKQFLEGCSNTETGKVLKVLAELTDRTGFDSARSTVNQALCYGASDADSLKNLYRSIYADMPELQPMPLNPEIPDVGQMAANLIAYDVFLRKEGAVNAQQRPQCAGLLSFRKLINQCCSTVESDGNTFLASGHAKCSGKHGFPGTCPCRT